MKAKAILLASVLLVGCQSTGNVQQHAHSLSAAGNGEAAMFTSQSRWMDDGTSIAPDGDLWAFIGDELKMGIPENDRIREQKQKYLRNKSYLSLSAAGQGEAAKFTSQARWMDDGTSIAPDGDLWAFIGDELKMGIPENDRIREQKQKYLRNKSYLHDVTLRAEPYMYWIAGQVKKRNMPMELVLLTTTHSGERF